MDRLRELLSRVQSWPIGRRLLAISLMSLLPIAYLLIELGSEKAAALSYAATELSGVRAIEPVRAEAMQTASDGADHRDALEQAAATIAKTALEHNLTLDPDADSHYLAGATLLRLPPMVQRVTTLSAFALDIVEHGMGGDDRSELTLEDSTLSDLAAQFKAEVAGSRTSNPDAEQAVKALDAYLEQVQGLLDNPISHRMFDPLKAAHEQVVASLIKFSASGTKDLEGLLSSRVWKLRGRLFFSLITALVFAGGSFLLMLVVQRRISRDVETIGGTIAKVRETHDFGLRAAIEGQDDLALMGAGLNELLMEIGRARAESDQARQRAEQAEVERARAIEASASGFETAVKEVIAGLSSGVTELQASAGSLASLAERSAAKAESISQTALNVTEVTRQSQDATGKLDGTFAEMEKRIATADGSAKRAVDESHRAEEAIQSLLQQVDRIGDIVQLIHQVSNQTNLLALNATIEAARAGEAGKGFAVVANEVKTLATQSRHATEEISASIQAIQDGVGVAVAVMRNIGAIITEVSGISGEVGNAAHQQREVLSIVTDGVGRTADSVVGITLDIGEARDGARETDNAARAMSQTADELGRQAVALEMAVRNVVEQMRGGQRS
jgi:methyl-accepting chemotaxis protein